MLHSQYLRENNGTTCRHGHPADCQLAFMNVEEEQVKVVAMDKKLVGWQRFDTRSIKWTVSAKLWFISSGAIVRMQKNTVFIHRRGNILVGNDALKRLLGLLVGLIPVHARPTARAEMTRQILQIFQKLQSLTDTLTLTIIFTRFIYVLTRNRSYDDPSFAYNRPCLLSTFPATASRVRELDPSALESGCVRRKVGNGNDLQGKSKTNICYILRIVRPRNSWCIWIVIYGVDLISQIRFLYQM